MNENPTQRTLRILVVEDDPEDARVTFRALRRSGRFEPTHARTALEALGRSESFDLYLVDCRLPDMSGLEVVRRLRERGITAPIAMLSSVQSDTTVQRALQAGADEFLVKSLTFNERLEADLERLLERKP